jgi:hypothetical protein
MFGLFVILLELLLCGVGQSTMGLSHLFNEARDDFLSCLTIFAPAQWVQVT